MTRGGHLEGGFGQVEVALVCWSAPRGQPEPCWFLFLCLVCVVCFLVFLFWFVFGFWCLPLVCTVFFRPTPLGFRQVVQHVQLHIA